MISKLKTLSSVIETDFHTYVRFVGKCDDVVERALTHDRTLPYVTVRSFSLSWITFVRYRSLNDPFSLFCFTARGNGSCTLTRRNTNVEARANRVRSDPGSISRCYRFLYFRRYGLWDTRGKQEIGAGGKKNVGQSFPDRWGNRMNRVRIAIEKEIRTFIPVFQSRIEFSVFPTILKLRDNSVNSIYLAGKPRSEVCIRIQGSGRMQKYRSTVRSCPRTAVHAQRRTRVHICRCVDGFAPGFVETDRSPTSSKIPLLLRFSLPVFFFHRYAMHLCTRFAFSHVWRKIKRGFLSSSLLFLSCILRLFVSFFLYFATTSGCDCCFHVKVNRDAEEERMRRFSPTSLSRLISYSEICH